LSKKESEYYILTDDDLTDLDEGDNPETNEGFK